MGKKNSVYARIFALCFVFFISFYSCTSYGSNILKLDDCIIVQKKGFNISSGYGFLEVSHHDSLFFLITNDYSKYDVLSVDSTYRFVLRLRDERPKIKLFSNCVNPVYIYIGENRLSLDQLASHELYELVVVEKPTVKTQNFQLPQGMNVETSNYDAFEDKAMDYFCKYVSGCREYSESYIEREWLYIQKKKAIFSRKRNIGYEVLIADYNPSKKGEIRKTSLYDVYMNVYVRKYNNNIIDSTVICNLKNESKYEKVDLKYKSSHRLINRERIIRVFANCVYNNMNHVELTVGNRKEYKSYIIVMREDGSLFDIVQVEERKELILDYSIQL